MVGLVNGRGIGWEAHLGDMCHRKSLPPFVAGQGVWASKSVDNLAWAMRSRRPGDDVRIDGCGKRSCDGT